jgi:hydroxymethylbilane synthase
VTLRIGTRGSALALWQAHHVKARLEASEPGLLVELTVIKTKGDKILDVPLSQVGGKGLFVKEIEEALLDRRVDLAVHSMKDVPAELMPGLALVAVSAREDARDALCSRTVGLRQLPPGARVGTSSVRRTSQILAVRRDLEIVGLRGNVDTRLRKLDEGELDAIVLAAAGLHRLGLTARITEYLDPSFCLPAIGQGVLGLEARADDATTITRVRRALHDEPTALCAFAERAFLLHLQGSCTTPLAAHATLQGTELHLDGLVASLDGTAILRDQLTGPASPELGVALAERLLERGAGELLGR